MAPNYTKRSYCSHQLNIYLTRAFGELKSKQALQREQSTAEVQVKFKH